MDTNTTNESSAEFLADAFTAELAKLEPTRQQRVLRKFVLAALGSIPWGWRFHVCACERQGRRVPIEDRQPPTTMA